VAPAAEPVAELVPLGKGLGGFWLALRVGWHWSVRILAVNYGVASFQDALSREADGPEEVERWPSAAAGGCRESGLPARMIPTC